MFSMHIFGACRYYFLTILIHYLFTQVEAGLFKTKNVTISGEPGDYYVISARSENLFQSIEVDLICTAEDRVVFCVKIDNCVPEVYSHQHWHFYYTCDLTVNAVEDGQRTKKNVVKSDAKFAFRHSILVSIGIEENKYVLWNGDRHKPLMADPLLRFMGKAEMKIDGNNTCHPDQMVVKGTIWKQEIHFIKGKVPEIAPFPTTASTFEPTVRSTSDDNPTPTSALATAVSPMEEKSEPVHEGSGVSVVDGETGHSTIVEGGNDKDEEFLISDKVHGADPDSDIRKPQTPMEILNSPGIFLSEERADDAS